MNDETVNDTLPTKMSTIVTSPTTTIRSPQIPPPQPPPQSPTRNQNETDDNDEYVYEDKDMNEKNAHHQSLLQYHYVILFYKYHTLSSDRTIMEQYKSILYNLCHKLHLSGRILIGTGTSTGTSTTTSSGTGTNHRSNNNNNNEGINGTLAGQYYDVLTFTHALLYYHMNEIPSVEQRHYTYNSCDNDDYDDHEMTYCCCDNNPEKMDENRYKSSRRRQEALQEFWMQSAQFFAAITTTTTMMMIHPSPSPSPPPSTVVPIISSLSSLTTTPSVSELRLTSPDDFKWSRIPKSNMHNNTVTHMDRSDQHDLFEMGATSPTAAAATSPPPPPPPTAAAESGPLFPDLNIKLVTELIGTGCPDFQQIPIEETSVGYLTPQEWHEHLTEIYQSTNSTKKAVTTTTSTTPTDSHESNDVRTTNTKDAIIIDCRNIKEYQIGHFQDAIHPNMTTFAQFVPWVQRNQILLQQTPKIYMYCTGGIRCEKASAYIRRTVPNVQQVYHLKGGIHKYLEQYGTADAVESSHSNAVANDVKPEVDTTTTSTATSSLWKGRNFVFDGRGSIVPSSIVNPILHRPPIDEHNDTAVTRNQTTVTTAPNVVGQCAYCQSPYDQFDPHCVCTVCREPILVCRQCQTTMSVTMQRPSPPNVPDRNGNTTPIILNEYHCSNHQHLQHCYFTNLQIFTREELQYQLQELTQHIATIAIGRRYKQKRKTIQKQMRRIQQRIDELHSTHPEVPSKPPNDNHLSCRNCGNTDCVDGRCWGFYGLKRKECLERSTSNKNTLTHEQKENSSVIPILMESTTQLPNQQTLSRNIATKKRRHDAAIDEMIQLNIAIPPCKYRDDCTGIRVPPCCTRIVQCTMKAKWYGQSILKVIQNEFAELAKPDVLNVVISHGLLRLNGKAITLNELATLSLKGSDTLGRIVHWHEAPVVVPLKIDVERFKVPSAVLNAYGADSNDTGTIYICNKPSSVPTHPAGPYLFNTLTMMVEGQECLPSQSLYPLHRTDRVTSGLTLCSTSVAVSRAFQKCLTNGNVDKMYLAKVDGKFVSSLEEVQQLKNNWKYDVGSCEWSDKGKFVIIDAPIYTSDPAAGIRLISSLGKSSKSYFQAIHYDKDSHTTVILCCPITGRNHQLRVHLQAIGFPIINDVQYGGRRDMALLQSCDENAALNAMLRIRDTASNNEECRVSSLTDVDVASAKKACKCCRTSGKDGIVSSFTKAQLLMEGHSICLHAYRYRIHILPPKSTKLTDQLAELNFQVRSPTWTNETCLQSISWLTTE